MHEPPAAARPALIGKRVVSIVDARTHDDGRVPPRALLGEFVGYEDDPEIRVLGTTSGRCPIPEFHLRIPFYPESDELEPGERLEDYLPGYGSVFGKPDYVIFGGRARQRWQRERDTQTGS